ncbi:MAG: NADPH-dependent FMN reductase [Dongiaceae bacterium]
MNNFKILGICGSLRKQSLNMSALKAAGSLMPHGMELTITNLIELPMYNQDVEAMGYPDSVDALREDVLAADGLLFAAPEHNWSMSASLKNGIDWLSRFKKPRVPFDGKPCAVLSATLGPLGGARVQYDVRRSVTGLGGHFLVKPEVFIGMANQKFDAQGGLADDLTRKFLTEQMVAFHDWIIRIKRAHDDLSVPTLGRLSSVHDLSRGFGGSTA